MMISAISVISRAREWRTVSRTEAGLRESYAGCDYTGQDWDGLERIIQLSAFITCTSQIFSQECESALAENFNTWLHQHDQPPTSPTTPLSTEECNASVSPHLRKEFSQRIKDYFLAFRPETFAGTLSTTSARLAADQITA